MALVKVDLSYLLHKLLSRGVLFLSEVEDLNRRSSSIKARKLLSIIQSSLESGGSSSFKILLDVMEYYEFAAPVARLIKQSKFIQVAET